MERSAIDPVSFDLSVKNPDAGEEVALREPETILAEIAALDAVSAGILDEIRALL